jgi:hypothetical protein
MVRTKLAAATIASAAFLSILAASASGAAEPGTYNFHDCTGPPGTPSGFIATKEYLPSTAAHPVSASLAFRMDGKGVFIALEFGDSRIAPGIPDNRLTTTCLVDFAQPAGTLPVSGFIAP